MPPKRIAPTSIPMAAPLGAKPGNLFEKFMETVKVAPGPALRVPEAAFGKARNPEEGSSLALEEMLIEAVVPTRTAVLSPSPTPRQKLMWVKGVLPLLGSVAKWLRTAGRRSAAAVKAATAAKAIASLEGLTTAQVEPMAVKTIADRLLMLGALLDSIAPLVKDPADARTFQNYAAYVAELKHMLKTGQSRPLPYEDAYGGGEDDDMEVEEVDVVDSEDEVDDDDFVVDDDEEDVVVIGASSVLAPVERQIAAYEKALDGGQQPSQAQKESLVRALDRAIAYFEESVDSQDRKLMKELEGVMAWVQSDPEPAAKPKAKKRSKSKEGAAAPKAASKSKGKSRGKSSAAAPSTAQEALQPIMEVLESHVIPNKLAKAGDAAATKKWERYFQQFTAGLRAIMATPSVLSQATVRKDLATALRKERKAFAGSFNMHEVELVSRLDRALKWLADYREEAPAPRAASPKASPKADTRKAPRAPRAVAVEDGGVLPSPNAANLPRRQRRMVKSLKRIGVSTERGTCPFGQPPEGKVCVRGYWKRK